MSAPACARPASEDVAAGNPNWPLERVLFALAALVSAWFLLLTAFVGVNQWLYVLLGACPASLVLRRLFSLRSVLYPRQEASS